MMIGTQRRPSPEFFVAIWQRFAGLARGQRAELRRASEPEELSLRPALYRLFPGERPTRQHLRIAFMLPACEHRPLASSLGGQLGSSPRNIAEQRVLQVARSDWPLDLVHLRRLAVHVEPVVDWSDFGASLWYWGERAKRQFVEEFYLARFGATKRGRE